MKRKRKIAPVVAALTIMVLMLVGCEDGAVTVKADGQEKDDTQKEQVHYEAMLFDNHGNNFLNFQGKDFSISPNKVKQWGYNTDGSWSSWYETSSVVTIEIDGQYVETCGSTVIFKDKRLDMIPIPDELSTKTAERTDEYTVDVDNRSFGTYIGLKNWWYDLEEKGQHGSKIVLVQSQDGYNIGAFCGNDVSWEVKGTLPKTTEIMVDGLPLYIHRCNFTIIDTGLIENAGDR